MIDYMVIMVDDFPTNFKPDDKASNPAAEHLLKEGTTDYLDT